MKMTYEMKPQLYTMDKESQSCKISVHNGANKEELSASMFIRTEVPYEPKGAASAEKSYVCAVCAKGFSMANSLSRHMLCHTHSCLVCSKTFTRKEELSAHILLHGEEKPHACKICHELFARKPQLLRHMLVHGKKFYTCEVCSEIFIRKRHLLVHEVVHAASEVSERRGQHKSSRAEGRPRKCKMCSKKFSNMADLSIHVRSQHKEHTNIKQEQSKGKIDFSLTASAIHEECSNIKHEECGDTTDPIQFSSTNDKSPNIKEECGEKTHECKICCKKFSDMMELCTHAFGHAEEELYECRICCTEFTSMIDLSTHVLIHESPLHECKMCNEKFVSMIDLSRHVLTGACEKQDYC